MAYKIAIASTDGVRVDETFGEAERFRIYEVENGAYKQSEDRVITQRVANPKDAVPDGRDRHCDRRAGCGQGGGCGGAGAGDAKVVLLADCRCIVCEKIGFRIRKQLERRAIAVFDVACTVEEALGRIITYFEHIDQHKPLKGDNC